MVADYLDALRPMFDCLTDGVCVADAQGRIVYANTAAGALLGPAADEVSKTEICSLLCAGLEGTGVENAASCPLKVPRGEQNTMTVKGRYAPTGRDLRVRCMRVRLPRLERLFILIEDVSSQAAAGRQKEEWRQMLAHDFRGPLTIALGALRAVEDMGASHVLDANDLMLIEAGIRNARRLEALIQAYLDTTRLEDGAMPVHAGSVDLEALIRGVVEDMMPAARAGRRELTFASAGSPLARADPELLRRALVNMIDNALKFTQPGGAIRVNASAQGRDSVIRVADNGPGITAGDLPRIFDRFYQGERTGRRPGLGLGLTFCRAAMRAMGGEIEVESEEGRGTIFTLRLPSAA